MPAYLRITIRFLQPTCHGRGDRGEPEWPPSPLRLFQALVEASAARWNERTRLVHAAPALRWLECQPPPSIIAPAGRPSDTKYRLYVPDNVGDKVAASWVRGGSSSIAGFRTEKDVRPTRLAEDSTAVHYLWPATGPDFDTIRDVLISASRSITHLGWGVDMVAAEASVLSETDTALLDRDGERWRPDASPSGTRLRIPVSGTLDALLVKHNAFLNRIGPDGFRPVAELTSFRVVSYRRSTESPRRPITAFALLRPNASGFRIFDAPRRGIEVAAMMRHSASSGEISTALGWSPENVARFVLGHGESAGAPHVPVQGPRLAFLPIPSIEPRGSERAEVVTNIRRVLVTVFGGGDGTDLFRLARLLSGADLIAEGNQAPVALLSRIIDSDKTIVRYTKDSTTWATVTPVVLPGHDDPRRIRKRLFAKSEGEAPHIDSKTQQEGLAKLHKRIDHLLRKAVRQAGYSEELARYAEIEWRPVGFWPGVEHVSRYTVPYQLRRFRRVHVRISWLDSNGARLSVPGPICLGGGRFYGLGLFAAAD